VLLVLPFVFVSGKLATLLFTFADLQAKTKHNRKQWQALPESISVSFWPEKPPEGVWFVDPPGWHSAGYSACTGKMSKMHSATKGCVRATQLYESAVRDGQTKHRKRTSIVITITRTRLESWPVGISPGVGILVLTLFELSLALRLPAGLLLFKFN